MSASPESTPTDREILAAASDEALLQYILATYAYCSEAAKLAFATLAVDLHNSGRLDLIAAVTPTSVEVAKGHEFFVIQRFYYQVIPSLDVDPLRLMEAITTLVKAAGNDLMSQGPNAAFSQWAAAKPDRPLALLAMIDSGVEAANDYLSLILEAGARTDLPGFLGRTVAYVRLPHFRLGALTALSRLDWSGSSALLGEAAVLIRELLDENPNDDILHGHIIIAAAAIARDRSFHAEVLDILTNATSSPGDSVSYCAASVLFNARENLSKLMIDVLLGALEEVNSTQRGTLDLLDIALSELIRERPVSRFC